MTVGTAILAHLGFVILCSSAIWLVQVRTRNAGIIDAVWPFMIGAGAVLYAVLGPGHFWVRLVTGVLAALWALRLGGYLALRNVGKPEDRRYAELRQTWGARANLRMLLFFLFQALVAWVVGFGFLPAAWGVQAPSMPWLLAGIGLGAAGIIGEGIADQQLRRFKRNATNRGRVCDVGLWRYSRHPNYFFECLHWLAYPCLSVAAPYAGLSLLGPVVITLLLLKVSGIPTVEAENASRQRAGYVDYARRTSALIPWPPRKGT